MLSQERSNVCVEYLISNGIAPERLALKNGKGDIMVSP